MEVAVIRTGEIAMPHGYVFRAAGGPLTRLRAGLSRGPAALTAPCLAFVIRHPSAGVLVVDTGFHPDAQWDLRRDFGIPMSLLFRGLRPAPDAFDVQLRNLGVDPVSVRRVVMTHLHVDHTSGMRLLPNAQFTIARSEWAAALGRYAAARGYVIAICLRRLASS